jgi:hypothetical protein
MISPLYLHGMATVFIRVTGWRINKKNKRSSKKREN